MIMSVLVFTAPAFAAKFAVLPAQGKTQFTAIGKPNLLPIHGEGVGPQGEVTLDKQNVTGTLDLPLAGLTTAIDKRDEHMKHKYLETDKFPQAELKVTEMVLPALAPGATGKQIPFKGELDLHGVKHPVTGTADVELTATGYKIVSKFKVVLSDYKIDIPTYFGVTVADNVDVEVGFEVKK